MLRTQISLTEGLKRLLDQESARTGRSMSQLIREAVQSHLGPSRSVEDDVAAIDAAFGAWQDRELDGAAQVERLRSGRRLHRS